ncbi:S-adenosylmethionine hydrolase [Natronospira proteinivora]|uniref:S-adenosylmethionine hydrolase n=1 Tax=Natronospira proteinivora TaxID=1807133 RepID=A0ABT1G539_9GAMM|nr:SAM-dependent chlorinase/fluorinase [Natronospira proteinivora]MCP1726055.1 S-adenosylmethionine hydrolase [Natronospira proteinivora]
MLFAFTDFQHQGPYQGELEAAARRYSNQPFIHLMHDAPRFQPASAGRLLSALSRQFLPGDICLAVVDPGVGSARYPVAVESRGIWFVGPDNGLLSSVTETDASAQWWEITWHPAPLSSSFHGRDLFAPFAGQLAAGYSPTAIGARPLYDPIQAHCPEASIIYIDGYGNCVTGIPAGRLQEDQTVTVGGRPLSHGFTFSSVPPGEPLWYCNSMGLVEIAINQASAADSLQLEIGNEVSLT